MPNLGPGVLPSIRNAILLTTSWAAIHVSASVISANKASTTNFELQTNLVSCASGGASPSSAAGNPNKAGNESDSGAMAVTVCSPPESKLFSNIKVISGTPHPGPTGVRGRLYDVGKLCDEKVIDKIDRAWVAFLDCDGCSLTTKLANLEGSNPQAILIYNQTSCVFPAPTVTTPVATVPSAKPSPSSGQEPAVPVTPLSPAPEAPTPAPTTPVSETPTPAPATTEAPAPATSQPADPNPDSGTSGGEGNGNAGDALPKDPEQGADNTGESVSKRSQMYSQHIHSREDIDSRIGFHKSPRRRSFETIAEDKYSLFPKTPRPRPKPRPIAEDEYSLFPKIPRPRPKAGPIINDSSAKLIRRREPPGDSGTAWTASVDPSELTIEFPTTVAMTEQGTVDYLFRMLLGPASLAPLPTALRALKTNVHPQSAEAADIIAIASDSGDSGAITDLMVSISPSYGESSSSETKFLSMSKPVFASVIGILCAVVCGVVLFYVVRPLILRRRSKSTNEVEVALDDEKEEDSSSRSSSRNGHDEETVYGDHMDRHAELVKYGYGGNNIEERYGRRLPALAPVNDHVQVDMSERFIPPPPGDSNSMKSVVYDHKSEQSAPLDDTLNRGETADTQEHLKRLLQSEAEAMRNPPQEEESPDPSAIREHAQSTLDTTLRRSVASPPPSPLEHIRGQPSEEQTDNDGSLSASSLGRNGNKLFYELSKEKGLATTLYRQHKNMETTSSVPSLTEDTLTFANTACTNSQRTSLSNDQVFTPKRSLDLYRHEINSRCNEVTRSASGGKVRSRTSAAATAAAATAIESSRASFSDDFATGSRGRRSLDALRTTPGTSK